MTFITRSSHVRVFERCERRWYFEEIMKHKADDTPAMRFGTAMHLELERWLRDGMPPDSKLQLENLWPGLAARKSLHLLPTPGKDLMVEHKFIDTKLVSGVEYHGTVDLADPREDAPIHLYDHKSTAGLAFIKSAAELQQDVSATFYAHQLRWLWGEPKIKSRWIYTERARSGQVKPVDFDLTSAMIDDRLAVTVKSVGKMVVLSMAQSHIDAPPNWDACNDYNRKCPHWGKCELTKSIAVSTESENNVNLLAKVANGVHPKTEETDSTPASETAPAGKTLSLREKMAAAKAMLQPSTEKLLETSIAMNNVADRIVEGLGAAAHEAVLKERVAESLAIHPPLIATGVNPPDAAPPTFEAAPAEEPKKGKQKATPLEPEIAAVATDYSNKTMAAELVKDGVDPIPGIIALIEEARVMLADNVTTTAQHQSFIRLTEAAFWLGWGVR